MPDTPTPPAPAERTTAGLTAEQRARFARREPTPCPLQMDGAPYVHLTPHEFACLLAAHDGLEARLAEVARERDALRLQRESFDARIDEYAADLGAAIQRAEAAEQRAAALAGALGRLVAYGCVEANTWRCEYCDARLPAHAETCDYAAAARLLAPPQAATGPADGGRKPAPRLRNVRVSPRES